MRCHCSVTALVPVLLDPSSPQKPGSRTIRFTGQRGQCAAIRLAEGDGPFVRSPDALASISGPNDAPNTHPINVIDARPTTE